MGRRTNTAVWLEKLGRWQINVQKDGKRRSFYSFKPGRTGQREANNVSASQNSVLDNRKRTVSVQ